MKDGNVRCGGWVVGEWGLLPHPSSYFSSPLSPHPPYCFVKLVSLHSRSTSFCWLPSKCNLINEFRLLMFCCEILHNITCLHCTPLWMYRSGDSISKLKFRLNWMSVASSLVGAVTRLEYQARRGQKLFIVFCRKCRHIIWKHRHWQ